MIILKLIPVVIVLIKTAEKLFDEVPESGTQKKAYVMEAIKAIINGLAGKDDAKKTIEKVNQGIDPYIDVACSMIYPNKKV